MNFNKRFRGYSIQHVGQLGNIIGASLSEPHTGQTASPRCLYIYMYVGMYRTSFRKFLYCSSCICIACIARHSVISRIACLLLLIQNDWTCYVVTAAMIHRHSLVNLTWTH